MKLKGFRKKVVLKNRVVFSDGFIDMVSWNLKVLEKSGLKNGVVFSDGFIDMVLWNLKVLEKSGLKNGVVFGQGFTNIVLWNWKVWEVALKKWGAGGLLTLRHKRGRFEK